MTVQKDNLARLKRLNWTDAQRAQQLTRVKQMVRDFDPDECGQITISVDGTVIDGHPHQRTVKELHK